MSHHRSRRSRVHARRSVPPLLAVFFLVPMPLLTSCDQAPDRPNVVLIVMDTLRADHLGCHGYEREVSPEIDTFAAGSDVYDHAYATAPWTVPSHGSLFTGKLPFRHGAHTYKSDERGIMVAPLPESHVTLAEVFSAEGYRTGAFVANDAFLGERFQFDQGFATYHVEPVHADRLNRRAAQWLREDRGTPFFMFMNFMDTHRIYNTLPRPGLLPEPAVQDQGELLDALYEAAMPADRPVSGELVARVTDQYDTAVANLDEQIGVLLDFLRDEGVLDETIVVLTSDHGEFLGEHHLVEHSKHVYEEVVHVPLMVRMPGQSQGERIETPVSLADVPDMLFDRMPPGFAAEHRAEFSRDPDRDPLIVENYYTRRKDLENPAWRDRFDCVRTAIYDWPHKAITASNGERELYRLDVDPGEANDLADQEPRRLQRMVDELLSFMEERGRPGTPDIPDKPLSEREIRRLKSLGYLGD